MIPKYTIKKQNGIVYTPKVLADYLSKKTVDYLFNPQENFIKARVNFKDLRILDPSCGQGDLLFPIWECIVKRKKLKSINGVVSPKQTLFGIDIDKEAVHTTQKRINELDPSRQLFENSNVININPLVPKGSYTTHETWQEIKQHCNALNGFDIVIANPPWGADTSSYRNKLDSEVFSLLQGQFDSSDLFIEMAVNLIKPGGLLSFIVPDSIFAFERKNLRKLLLDQTQLLFLARVGEGFFPNVSRGSVLFIAKRNDMYTRRLVDSFRLDSESRKLIISGSKSFSDVEKQISKKIKLSRFKNNKNYEFDIDLTSDDVDIISKISATNFLVEDFTNSFRGVELSKKGSVIQCDNCNVWIPKPRKNVSKCPNCGNKIIVKNSRIEKVITSKRIKDSSPIIVGENIRRYSITKKFNIIENLDGINYKNLTQYSPPKIVVRKTGVGITSSIDYTGSFTNQVVYSFVLKCNTTNDLGLELISSIINSRMMYFYVIKKYGEVEWRSHPYLTITSVRNLPLPNNFKNISLSKTDLNTLHKLRKTLMNNEEIKRNLDSQIERMVANLYGLSRNDYEYIFMTLGDIEQLLPVRRLLNISIDEIFPLEG